MATTYLTSGNLSSAGNQKKWTFSAWIKKSTIGVDNGIFNFWVNSTNYFQARFRSEDDLVIGNKDGGSWTLDLIPTRKLRDTSGWYHIVLQYDSAQATSSDRASIWINGEKQTSFATSVYPSQNANTKIPNSGYPIEVGRARKDEGIYYANGAMSHVNFCDGYAYSASDFGETDATTGEWKIKTSLSVSYGTNGFFILKDGNGITDQSGQGNDFTLGGGTLTDLQDCPDDVFCTLNPLQKPFPAQPNDFSNVNTSVQGNHSDWQRMYGTIGAYKGKWFYEWKMTTGTNDNRVGWDSIDNINDGNDNYYSGLTLGGDGMLRGGIKGHSGYSPNAQMTAAHSGGNLSFTTNDIIGMALDRDNNTISIYKNGNLEVNAYSFAGASNCSVLLSKGYAVAPSVNFQSASGNAQVSHFNFGNGYFGTTAISSEGTNASGIGKFEYDVPTGYTALSTKGLNA